MIKILFILMLGVSSLLSHHITGNKKVMIAYAEEWPPYSYRDHDGKMKGILIDLMDKLMHKLHVEVTHEGFPWKRAQLLAKEGTFDAVITYPSQKRKEYYLPSKETLINLEWRGFVSTRSKYFDSVMITQDPLTLDGYLSYSSVLGDGTTELLYKNANITHNHKAKNVENSVTLLAQGRTDFFVNAKLTVINLILKNRLQKSVQMHPKVYKKVPFTFLLSHKSDINKEVVPALDELVKELKNKNEYQKLLDQIISEEFHRWLTK